MFRLHQYTENNVDVNVITIGQTAIKEKAQGTLFTTDAYREIVVGIENITLNDTGLEGLDKTYTQRIYLGGKYNYKSANALSISYSEDQDKNMELFIFAPDDASLTTTSTGTYTSSNGRSLDDAGEDQWVAAYAAINFKDAVVSNSYNKVIIGGNNKINMAGTLLYQDDDFDSIPSEEEDITNNFTADIKISSTGSFTSLSNAKTNVVIGYQTAAISDHSEVNVLIGGGKVNTNLTCLSVPLSLIIGKEEISARLADVYDIKSSSKLAVNNGSIVGAAIGYKDIAINVDSEVTAAIGGTTSGNFGISCDAALDYDSETFLPTAVDANILAVIANTTTSSGSISVNSGILDFAQGYSTLNALDSNVMVAFGGKNALAVNFDFNPYEEDLDFNDVYTIFSDIVAIMDEDIELKNRLTKVAAMVIDCLNNFNSTLAIDVAASIKSNGTAQLTGNNSDDEGSTVICGYKNVTTVGHNGSFFIGSDLSLQANLYLDSAREKYKDTAHNDDACKKLTFNDAIGTTLAVSLKSNGNFSSMGGTVRSLIGFKNINVVNNERGVGGEGQDDLGILYLGGNVDLAIKGIPLSDVLTIDGSEARNASTGLPVNPINLDGAISGLIATSIKSTGKAYIESGVSGIPTHSYNNMDVIGYKDVTIVNNSCEANVIGGDLALGGTITASFANHATGGAYSDLHLNSGNDLMDAMGKFFGKQEVILDITTQAGDFGLTSIGKISIGYNSIVDTVIGYKNVSVSNSSAAAIFGGDITTIAESYFKNIKITLADGSVEYDFKDLESDSNIHWISSGKVNAANCVLGDIGGYKDVTLSNCDANQIIGGELNYFSQLSEEGEEISQYRVSGKFNASHSTVGSVSGFKTTTISDSQCSGFYTTDFMPSFAPRAIKAGGTRTAKLSITNSDFITNNEVGSSILGYTKVDLKNIKGTLQEIQSTDFNDKINISTSTELTITRPTIFGTPENNSETVKNVSIMTGAGNDTITIGDNSNVNIMGLIDFGEGSDTLKVGNNSFVVLKSTGEGLKQLTLGKNVTAYLSDELLPFISKMDISTVIHSIGDADTALNFTALGKAAGQENANDNFTSAIIINAIEFEQPNDDALYGDYLIGKIFNKINSDTKKDSPLPPGNDTKIGIYNGWVNSELDAKDFFQINDWKSLKLTSDSISDLQLTLWKNSRESLVLDDTTQVDFTAYADYAVFSISTKTADSFAYTLTLA